jgi:predicted negative regulator of RcsB-dependent stress response
MEEYYNADDQARAVKNWLKKYSVSIILGLVLGLGLFYGIRFVMTKQVVASEQAANAYFNLLNSTGMGNPEQTATIANAIVTNYAKTPYASMAQFFLAQNAVNKGDYAKATVALQWVIDHSKTNSFRQIARIRLARVLSAQQKMTEALALLQQVDDKTYMPLIETTRGDIFLAQKQYAEARQAYQLALKNADQFAGLQSMLQMKISDPQLAQAG